MPQEIARRPIRLVRDEMRHSLIKRICLNGFIAELRNASKEFECCECGWPINYGDYYYSITKGGGGLSWLKHPDRVHRECVRIYLRIG